jgi:hypothetical protein
MEVSRFATDQSYGLMSQMGQNRPGRASNKSGYDRYGPKAEVSSEH